MADVRKITRDKLMRALGSHELVVAFENLTTGVADDIPAQIAALSVGAEEAQATADGVAGRSPGGRVGVLSSKGADGISASYDVGTSTEKDAGHWNLTTYGTRFIRLSRMFGAGPLQVGPSLGDSAGGAWPGPLPAVW